MRYIKPFTLIGSALNLTKCLTNRIGMDYDAETNTVYAFLLANPDENIYVEPLITDVYTNNELNAAAQIYNDLVYNGEKSNNDPHYYIEVDDDDEPTFIVMHEMVGRQEAHVHTVYPTLDEAVRDMWQRTETLLSDKE